MSPGRIYISLIGFVQGNQIGDVHGLDTSPDRVSLICSFMDGFHLTGVKDRSISRFLVVYIPS